MLTLEPPFYRLGELTVFRDHADPDLFHYLPGRPRLAGRGDGGDDDAPRFTLYKYRRDLTDNPELDPTRGRGAGLALFEVELPADRLVMAQMEVASQSGRPDARLSPVVFRSGTVSTLLAHAEGDGLVEDLIDRHPAPITPPHRAAFAVALSAEGATLFERAAAGGELPFGVVYDLRFLALSPSLHARVTMDYERIYDRFAASVGFTYYVSVKLDVDLAWLLENEAITIEITSFSDAEDARRQQERVLDLVKARVVADFFRSGIPPRQEQGTGMLGELLGGLMGGSGEVTSASAFFVLKARYEAVREVKHHELLFAGRTAVELPHTAVGLISTLAGDDGDGAGGEGGGVRVVELDLDDPFFSALDVRVSSAIDFASLPDLTAAVAHLAHGDHRKSFEFTPGPATPGRFQVPLTDPRADRYGWEVEYHFDPSLGTGPTRIVAGPFSSRARVLVVDPFEHFRHRRLRLHRGPVDPAEVPRLRVDLRLRDTAAGVDLVRSEVILDEQRPEVVWRHRLPVAPAGIAGAAGAAEAAGAAASPPLRLLARTSWEDARGELHRGDEVVVEGEDFVALGPYRDLLEVSVQSVASWERLSQVLAELRYRDGDHLVEQRLRFDPETAASQTVRFPLLDPTRRGYAWRQTLFTVDGTVAESDWQEADRAVLVVGREPAGPREVRIVWVGAPGAALGLRVDLWPLAAGGAGSEGEMVSTFLRAGETEGRVALPPAAGALDYRYKVSRFTAAGEEPVKEGTGTGALLVVQTGG